MANTTVNKVVLGNQTLLDLTADTVTPQTLYLGTTAHDASGAAIVGTMSGGGTEAGTVTQDAQGYLVLDDEASSGRVTVEALSVTQNGTYTAQTGKAYSPVTVSVGNSYTASDEGKVVSNGALVAQTAMASSITANGTYDTTTNNSVTVNVSGGGGGSSNLVVGALRPDAELAQSWSYDKYIVADENVTIPSYTTSATVLKSASQIGSNIEIDHSDYTWILVYRALATPVYSTSEPVAGRMACYMHSMSDEYLEKKPLDNRVDQINTVMSVRTAAAYGLYRYVYHGNELTRDWVNSQMTGTYTSTPAITLSGPTVARPHSSILTINSPTLNIRGNTTYMKQSDYEAITDIRYQYVFELYRSPKNNLNIEGFNAQSQHNLITSCYLGNGKLI